MRKFFLVGFTIVILLLSASISEASLLQQCTAYWYRNGDQIVTQFNPSTEWLNDMIPTGQILMSVQQAVYDPVSTFSILKRNGDGTSHTGFLYAYSITNFSMGDSDIENDMGLTEFKVDWTPAPVYVTVARSSLPDWVVDTTVSDRPAWKWMGNLTPGVRPGETVGGFWAVSNVSVSGELQATTLCGLDAFAGRTVGPVPEPASFATLVMGIVGLGLKKRLRGK